MRLLDLESIWLLLLDLLCLDGVYLLGFFCFGTVESLSLLYLLFISDLYVLGDDAWIS